jgi:gp178
MEKELKNHSTGNRIKELRKANKLTHKELAGKLGISTRTLQMWESGKNLSFIPKMSKLADFFGVSITDLFDLPGPKGMDKIKESGGCKKATIPKFVADWYEGHKDDFEGNLFRCIDQMPDPFSGEKLSDFDEWIVDDHTKPFQTLVNMHQFGYTVEEEKRYLVKMKGLRENTSYLNYDSIDAEWYFADAENGPVVGTHCTRKELESAGFDWIFSCEGIEVEEVE